jgi:transcriptional regulator with XRE-family HTH domain
MLSQRGILHNTPDSATTSPPANNQSIELIGKKIRALRKSKKLSLTELSEKSGLSIGFLSQVERDMSNLSVKALFDLSRVLGVNISYFFDTQDEQLSPVGPIVRLKERKKIFFGQGICDELVSPRSCSHLELIYSRFAPGSSSGRQAYYHDGEEAGVVLSGNLELILGDEVYLLEAGDSFGFASRTPHRYGNPGKTETIVVWAITPPTY